MVQRTDIAGSVGGGMGRVDPGDHGMCRHAPNGAFIERSHLERSHRKRSHRKSHLPETSAYSYFGGKKCGRPFMTAVPSDHAIYVETPGPIKR